MLLFTFVNTAACSDNDLNQHLSSCHIEADKVFPEGGIVKAINTLSLSREQINAAQAHSNFILNCMSARGYKLDVELKSCTIEHTFEWADKTKCYKPKPLLKWIDENVL